MQSMSEQEPLVKAVNVGNGRLAASYLLFTNATIMRHGRRICMHLAIVAPELRRKFEYRLIARHVSKYIHVFNGPESKSKLTYR